MAAAFAAQYKKDLSTETLKAKLAQRKSISQKESRHKEFNKGRQFGWVIVNTQALSRNGELSLPEETGERYLLTKPSPKSSASAKSREQERREMLQRYKAEKELRKLKEQRKKPAFKCGQFKPQAPAFLPKSSHIPGLSKPKDMVSKAASVVAPSKSSLLQRAQRKQIYVDKPPPEERKGVQPSTSTTTSGRITRAAALTKIPQISRPAISTGRPTQKRETANNGKQ